MKKIILPVFAAALLGLASAPAQASSCSLQFEASGGGVQFIVGSFSLGGGGVITCTDSTGVVTSTPVYVTLGGDPVALRFAFVPTMTVAGTVKEVGVHSGAEDLFGSYMTVDARASLFRGVQSIVGFQNPMDGMNMEVSLSKVSGYGFEMGFTKMVISAAE